MFDPNEWHKQRDSNLRPCGFKSSTFTTRLTTALLDKIVRWLNFCIPALFKVKNSRLSVGSNARPLSHEPYNLTTAPRPFSSFYLFSIFVLFCSFFFQFQFFFLFLLHNSMKNNKRVFLFKWGGIRIHVSNNLSLMDKNYANKSKILKKLIFIIII